MVFKNLLRNILKGYTQNNPVDDSNFKIQVKLEEYRTLREESLNAMKNQQATLSFGTAAIGVIVGCGLNLWNYHGLITIIFTIFTPFLCYLIMIIWMGEVARMMRAGKYLTDIEKYVNSYFGEDVLYWENWLRTKDENMKTPQLTNWLYKTIIALFFGIALASILTGAYKCFNTPFYWVILISSLIVFIAALVHIYFLGKKLEEK